ncbi:hypothetical protein R1flu_020781 [Riccia fluitans]|uniref:Uncharacterized protein n=1 Tax=Riccia fluitans TaxID=41844 RepID=A0ABD1ZMN9_9MARC
MELDRSDTAQRLTTAEWNRIEANWVSSETYRRVLRKTKVEKRAIYLSINRDNLHDWVTRSIFSIEGDGESMGAMLIAGAGNEKRQIPSACSVRFRNIDISKVTKVVEFHHQEQFFAKKSRDCRLFGR